MVQNTYIFRRISNELNVKYMQYKMCVHFQLNLHFNYAQKVPTDKIKCNI